MLDFIYTLLIAPLEYWMHAALVWGYSHTEAWGPAIVVMSLAVNIVILPIYIKAEILDLVATEVSPRKQPETLDEVEDAAPDELKLLDRHALERLLQQAVEEERYELAAKLKKAME